MILDKAVAVLKKDALTAIRYRNGFVLSAISPALQLATFYYLSRAVGPQFRPEGMSYFLFLLVLIGPRLMQQEGETSYVKAFVGASIGFALFGTVLSAIIALILKRKPATNIGGC